MNDCKFKLQSKDPKPLIDLEVLRSGDVNKLWTPQAPATGKQLAIVGLKALGLHTKTLKVLIFRTTATKNQLEQKRSCRVFQT